MKPVRLVMEAFGPYAGTTTLDFRCLHGKPLVLLHGPTGGGKTAILDAMCFALFGKSSGDERQGGDLRSDLAADDRLTRITFDFLHGKRQLRVVRVPTQQKKKSRGTGFTKHKAQAWLWERSGPGLTPEEDGVLLSEKPKGVDAEVRKILGFSEDQFRQIVVLPQGKFREFLGAPAEEKEKILKTLFGTAVYETITEELQKETALLKERFADNERMRQAILASVEVPDFAGLVARLNTLREDQAGLKAEAESCEERATAALAALQSGEESNKRFAEKVAAQEELTLLEKRQPEIAEQEKRLQRIARVKPLVPLADAVQGAAEAQKKAETAARLAQEELVEIERNFSKANEALSYENSADRKSAREEAEKRVLELGQLREDVSAYKEIVGQARDADSRLEKGIAAENEAAEKLKQLQARIEKLEGCTEKLAALELEEVKGEQDQAEYQKQKELFSAHEQLQKDIRALEESLHQLGVAEEKSLQAQNDATRERATLYLRWHQGQAARLAAQLKRGESCPVCGSTEHPSPRVEGADDLPGEAMLQAADAAMDLHRSDLEKIRVEMRDNRTRKEGLQEQAQEKWSRLGDAASIPRAEWQARGDALAASRKERKTEMQALRRDADELRAARDKMPGLQAAVDRTKAERATLELHAREIKTNLSACERRLPGDLRDVEAYERALRLAEKTKESLHAGLEKARNNEREAAQARSTAVEKTANAIRRVGEFAQQWKDAGENLSRKRAEIDLVDEELYQRTLADAAQESKLQDEVSVFQAAIHGARGRLEQAVRAVGDTPFLELDELRQRRDTAVEAAKVASGRLHDAQSSLRVLEKERGRYEALVEEGGADEKRYRSVAALSEATAGKNPRRLSLQRYVLASLLDDVLAHASERLNNMSTGRYRVLRDDGLRDARSAGGLDLLVEDQYTGERRPISTLSGGESFQAALALSLGLADVIQALSGGIRVDSLFIDEGFGTLDGEALERAIEELLKLRDGGRLVGIISHVSELRHRISSRIEVRKGERGSSITVHAGG